MLTGFSRVQGARKGEALEKGAHKGKKAPVVEDKELVGERLMMQGTKLC